MKSDQGPGDLADRPEGQAVEHAVLDFSSPVNRRESMGVMPELVGTLDLLVDESVGGGFQCDISERQRKGMPQSLRR